MHQTREFNLSKASINYMKMVAERVGIDIANYREDAIYNRLSKRLRELHLQSFDDYCRLLRIDISEEVKFINLITNITTYFFREKHHFEFIAKVLLPNLLAKKKKVRIWSAGCSTGEEPYSISIILHEANINMNEYDIKILATDVNSDALDTAQNGLYTLSQLKDVNQKRRKAWFHRVSKTNDNLFAINNDIKKIITFRQLNLVGQWPLLKSFDIIICRNVFIYFKPEIRRRILDKFSRLLAADGILILGFSENISEHSTQFKPIGNTIYKKIRG